MVCEKCGTRTEVLETRCEVRLRYCPTCKRRYYTLEKETNEAYGYHLLLRRRDETYGEQRRIRNEQRRKHNG